MQLANCFNPNKSNIECTQFSLTRFGICVQSFDIQTTHVNSGFLFNQWISTEESTFHWMSGKLRNKQFFDD